MKTIEDVEERLCQLNYLICSCPPELARGYQNELDRLNHCLRPTIMEEKKQ
jgi:hypothetical protein